MSNRKNAFTLQLYTARKEKGKWKKIEVLPFCRPNHNYMHPAISPDGNTLFFVSDKPRGKGGTDIYYAQKKGDKWGRAINLDSMINTRAHEGFPFMSTDGKLFFCSKGHLGFGGYDIFMSQKTEDGSWTKPINVGKPINSPLDDISITFNKEMTAGAFTSARNGGNDDIFLFSLVDDISVEAKPMEVTQNAEPTPTENMNTSPSLENKKSKSNEAITTNETEVNIPEKEVENAAHLESTNNVAMPQNETPLTVTDLEKNPSIEMEHIPTNDNVPSENHTITEKTEEEPTELPEPKEVELAPSNDNTPVEASVSASMEQKTKEDFSPSIPDNNEDNILATADTLTDVSINEPAKTNVKITTESTESPTETSSHEKVISEDMLKVKQNSDVSNTPNTETGSLQEIHPSEDMASSVQGLTANATRQELSFKELKKAVSKGDYTSGMYFTIKDLNFAPNEYLLAPKMTLKLKPILKLLEQNDDIKLDITVHTQSIGYDENNLLISQKRAKAIKNYLLYKGIPADRITVRGLGETDLANHCANGVVCTEDEHMENERVAVRIQ
ncbi:MAG TPA: hypothetical protein ENJ45_05245 [Phaeodactylibacter sp.]|nr:hypothetical protein [Phaeodactylibacter sp.]